MNVEQWPINWFDFAVLGILALGIQRGRKHGMSVELVHLLQWLAILFGAAFLYKPLGSFFSSVAPFSLLFSYVAVYILLALLITGLFAVVKRGVGGKLLGSDVFGSGEYYLGMAAGPVRFACMLMVVLALLNAKYVSSEQAAAMDKAQVENYGKVYFPRIYTVQRQVFVHSFLGGLIKRHIEFLMIEPTPPESKPLKRRELDLP